MPGQPEVTWRGVQLSKSSEVRHGFCVHDVTEKESLPITALNTIDGEKPPPFKYIKRMLYPVGFHPASPKSCDCIGRCSDSKRCSCAVKNGGEIPYNRNESIVEIEPLYTRGWDVRALTYISSGTFICEYAGQLLEDTEAERRIGKYEYLLILVRTTVVVLLTLLDKMNKIPPLMELSYHYNCSVDQVYD
ncbi:hypothetical protein P3S68_000529 [Capsicum galapagoense]